MDREKQTNKLSEKEPLYNIVIIILGILMSIAGVLMVYSKTAGDRWGNVSEGFIHQIGGALFILVGIVGIIKAINNLSSNQEFPESLSAHSISADHIRSKVFVDATINSFAYGRILIIFIAVFIWFLFAIYNYVKMKELRTVISSTSFLSIAGSVLFLLIVAFVYLRKHWVYKVKTDATGITIIRLLNKVLIRWGEIKSLGVRNSLLLGNVAEGLVAEIITRDRNYLFPLTMKEKNQAYPKYSGQLFKFKWKDKDGNTKELTPENCPLYLEIRDRLKVLSINSDIPK